MLFVLLTVMVKSQDLNSALHWAAKNNNIEVAKLLIAANANVNLRNKVFSSVASIATVDYLCCSEQEDSSTSCG